MTEEIRDELTYRIIGCAMTVHSVLGNGFQEIIYQRALVIEMEKKGLSFQRELEMQLYYEEHSIGSRRVDFLVEEMVIVELKAVIKLEEIHLAQGLNYLIAYQVERGLLLNFGAQSLEVKRLRPPKNKQRSLLQSSNPKI
tara:strand:- start:424 stop:843 length:420 start_codon:yes stop_codon:yes gene_type:complete